MFTYKAKVKRVVDGDTIVLLVDLGFGVSFVDHFRVLDLDTPEIFHPSCPAEKIHGEEAKIKAKQLLDGKELVITTIKRKKGKYGRYLAHIYAVEAGIDFATTMKACGFQKKENYA